MILPKLLAPLSPEATGTSKPRLGSVACPQSVKQAVEVEPGGF